MSGIFSSYDVRGIYPEQINEDISYKIGLRAGKLLKIKEIAVGRDGRVSSPTLFQAFANGAIDSGIKVIDLGMLSSPMLSFFCVSAKKKGVMITASHNPKEYNGIKFIDEKGIQLGYTDLLNKLQLLMSIEQKYSGKKGKIIKKSPLVHYIKHLLSKFKGKINKKSKLTLTCDCSNGMGSIPLEVLKKLNIDVHLINNKIDGTFPAHSPDPTKSESLLQLKQEVLKNKSSLGIMFDGDSDRGMFVDEKGHAVPADLSFLLLALHEIKNTKSKIKPIFLCDLRFSRTVFETLSADNSTAVRMRVGNPFYKKLMHSKKNIILGGEFSGHIMYKENFGIDDPLFALLKMLVILSNSGATLSQMISTYKKYASSGEVDVKVENPKDIIQIMHSVYKNHEVDELDGITVDLGNSWFTIRPSNTEPLVRFVIEGTTSEEVEKQKEVLLKLIRENDRN
jgi:phosphomannomutase